MEEKCPICNSDLSKEWSSEESGLTYTCPLCGTYHLGDYVRDAIVYGKNINSEYNICQLHATLFYYLRVIRQNYKNNTQRVNIYASLNDNGVSLNTIYNLVPRTFSKHIDMIMELLYSFIKNIGADYTIARISHIGSAYQYSQLIYNIFLVSEKYEPNLVENVIKILLRLDYLYRPDKNNLDKFTFTPKGWGKIDSLQRNKKSKTAFIAMSFKRTPDGKEDSHIKDLIPKLQNAEDSIKAAIEKAGYVPIIIKDVEHNQSIPQEIEYEIKNAAFVVTDLTLQNNGAYYEAGVAKGLGKEVIFTCNKKDFNKIHFDTRQINTIIWDDENTFVDDLYKRIKFTVGEYSEVK